jgi:hypothetical protein
MKTTVDIPDSMLEELIGNTGSNTKRDAILQAIAEFNRRRRVAALADVIGSCEQMISFHELDSLRAAD